MRSSKRQSERRCEACGGLATPTKVSVYRRRRGRHVLFRSVPALVCRECGQRIFEADAVELMEHKLNQPIRASRTAELLLL